MKKLIRPLCVILLFASLLAVTSESALAVESKCWYIKRRGADRPDFPPDAAELSKYDCYYADLSLSPDSERKRLYLTFDAGYENGNLARVLDTLKSESVPAAFFLLDNIIIKNTDLVMRMEDEGHLVCNHTKNHKDLSGADIETIRADLSALEEIYTEKTGRQMAKYFRFPEGRYSLEAVRAVQSLGYKTVFWSFGYEDWDNCRQPSREYAMKKILDNTHNGAVILLHPNSRTNADILPELISKWREMGYEFGTLDELCV